MSAILKVLDEMSMFALLAFAVRLGWDYKQSFEYISRFYDWIFEKTIGRFLD